MKNIFFKITILFFASLPSSVLGQESFTVLLDWFVNPDHAPLYVALEKGYFSENGLNVKFISPSDPNDPPKLVAAGRGDLAITYQPQLYLQVHQGLDLVRVGTLIATPLNSLVVLKDGPIKTIQDLNNKKIGYSIGGFEDVYLNVMLRKYGLTIENVELVNVNFSLSPSLISGKVDAVIGAFRNFELNQMDIIGRPGRAFYVEEEGIPAYDELIFVTRSVDIDHQKISNFMDAVEKGVQYIVNHPNESWELFILNRPELSDELNKRAWKDTIPRFALRPKGLDTARYINFGKFLKQEGLIQELLPVHNYAIELKP